ncbi:MAG: 30S ribosomal protein S20 [Bacteroidales bacterium]|jgi:small subunit ribosomal protein S20|nr:30S ribosomal protein S20 [Bacteroidales bacterium]
MANHKSSKKRIRSNEAKREHNRYYAKTMRNSLRDFRAITTKEEAAGKINDLVSSIDKLAKRGIIHKNKAGNLKSEVMLKLNKLNAA